MALELTQTDRIAIQKNDSAYINNKGAEAYGKADYETAVEYYRLAAAMGNMQSVSNLGYCYMYGRSIEKNINLAVEYFKVAANCGVIDAIYKLGNIYFNGTPDIEPDKETGLYYYRQATDRINKLDLDPRSYPSLYLALAKEMMPEGVLATNLTLSYEYLLVAFAGYVREINDGAGFYKEVFQELTNLMESPCFDDVKKMREEMGADFDEFDFEDDEDEDYF